HQEIPCGDLDHDGAVACAPVLRVTLRVRAERHNAERRPVPRRVRKRERNHRCAVLFDAYDPAHHATTAVAYRHLMLAHQNILEDCFLAWRSRAPGTAIEQNLGALQL